MRKTFSEKAFTLVELAIVIVIIGLLVAGVLVGQELINQARVSSVIKQIASYEASFKIFRDKYKCLPGDCRNATAFISPSATNGNGNNKIDPDLISTSEMLYAWQHLSLAKMIKGSYNGLSDATKQNTNVEVNIPRIEGFDGGVWLFYRDSTSPMGGVNAYISFGKADLHVMVFASTFISGTNYRLYSGFTDAVSAQQIDTKIDDGLAGSGDLNTGNSINGSTCTNPIQTNTAWNGTVPTGYNLSSNREDCVIFKWLDM